MAIVTVTETNSDGQGRETVITRQVDVPDELIAQRDIAAKLDAAIDALSPYLAIANPTTAQSTAQAKRLTRAVIGILRLQRGRLDSSADV